MWKKTYDKDNKNNEHALYRIICYENSSTQAPIIREILVYKYNEKSEWHLNLYASNPEAGDKIKAVLGPHDFYVHCQDRTDFKFISDDKDLLATLLTKMVSIDQSFKSTAIIIATVLDVRLYNTYKVAPIWFIRAKTFDERTYQNTRNEMVWAVKLKQDDNNISLTLYAPDEERYVALRHTLREVAPDFTIGKWQRAIMCFEYNKTLSVRSERSQFIAKTLSSIEDKIPSIGLISDEIVLSIYGESNRAESVQRGLLNQYGNASNAQVKINQSNSTIRSKY